MVFATKTARAVVAVPKGMGRTRSMANKRRREITERMPGGLGCACRQCRTTRRMGTPHRQNTPLEPPDMMIFPQLKWTGLREKIRLTLQRPVPTN